MSNFIRQWNLQRDELLESGNILTRFDSIDGLIRNIDYVDMDSIEGKNQQELWSKMRRIARKLSKTLDDKVHVEGDVTFHLHKGFKIKGSKGGIYSPLTLDLDDGQVLTALFKNLRKSGDKVNPTKPTKVYAWYLNKQNITEYVFKGGEPKDNAELTRRLAFIIEKMHSKFIAKNPISESPKVIKARIDAMDIDLSNVVYSNDGNAESEKQKRIKELQAEYNPRESLLGTNAVAGGDDQAGRVRKRNEEIRKELKELGGEIPKDIAPELPKASPQKQVFYINLNEDDVMKYGKKILEALEADERLTDIRYKIQFENSKGFKQTVGNGIGQVKLDAIERGNIDISTAIEPTEEDEKIKSILVDIVISVSDKVDEMEDEKRKQREESIKLDKLNAIESIFEDLLKDKPQFSYESDTTNFYVTAIAPNGEKYSIGVNDTNYADEIESRLQKFIDSHKTVTITPENIAEFYPSMSDEEKLEYQDMLDSIFQQRTVDVANGLNISSKELYQSGSRKTENVGAGANVVGVETFGVKDNLQPIDEYIEEIKKSEEYKDYIAQKVSSDPYENDANLVEQIKNHEVYKQIMKDSHGGIMYDVSKRYDADELLKLWEQVQHKDSQGGIVKGAMNFLLENHKSKSEPTYDFDKFNSITSSKEFQKAQEELEEQLEADGTIDDFEDKLEELDKQFAELIAKELTDA